MPDDTDLPSPDRTEAGGPPAPPLAPSAVPRAAPPQEAGQDDPSPGEGATPGEVAFPPSGPAVGAGPPLPPGYSPRGVATTTDAPGFSAFATSSGAPAAGPGTFGAPGAGSVSAGYRSDVPRVNRPALLVGIAAALGVALLVAALVAWLIESGPGPAPPAAQQVVRATEAATHSFHYVSRYSSGGMVQTTVGDAGTTSGRQVITIGSEAFTVIVDRKACYFQGDATSLVDQLGIPPATAATYAGQWISLAPNDAPYAEVYAAVTARQALQDNIAFIPQRELPISTVAGRRVITVTGPTTSITVNGQIQPARGSAIFVVTAAKPHRPLRYSEVGKRGGQSGTFVMTFSRWNQPVQVSPPSSSVPYASLGAGSPGGGTGGGGTTTPGGPVLT